MFLMSLRILASAPVSAATPDISGAFNQAYQGQLAGYNANTASNNATMGALGGLGSAAIIGLMMSDERLKTEIRKIGEKFPSGEIMPLAHPNCYCILQAVGFTE